MNMSISHSKHNEQHPMQLPATIASKLVDYAVTFLHTTGPDTLVEVLMQPNSGNELHYHTSFTETFEVTEGILGIELDGRKIYLKPGQSATAPTYSKHRFFNNSANSTVRFRVRVSPARNFEQMLRIAYGLANDGKTNAKGVPGLLHASLLFSIGDTYFPGLPLWLQQTLFGAIARLARLLGKDKELLKYYTVRQ